MTFKRSVLWVAVTVAGWGLTFAQQVEQSSSGQSSVAEEQPSSGQSSAAAAQPSGGESSVDKDVLDPTASLMSFAFRDLATPNFYGRPGSGNAIQFQPVVPFKAWGTANILRVTLPFNTGGVPGRGLADVAIFNLTVFPAWGGRFGLGPVVNFASNPKLTTDRVQAGPAFGWVGSKGKWTYGLFNQNLFSSNTQITALQPILAYNIGKGWALSTGDNQWTIDWESSQFVNMPFGVQLGKICKVGKQLCRWAVNPEYNARNITGAPHWTVRFNYSLLVPAK